MNNLTLNKGKIYSPQAWVQYRCSSRWHSSICSFHRTICLRLRLLYPLLSLSPILSPLFSRCAAAEAVSLMCQVIIESLTSTSASHHLLRAERSFTTEETFLRGTSCSASWNYVVFGQKYHITESLCKGWERWSLVFKPSNSKKTHYNQAVTNRQHVYI